MKLKLIVVSLLLIGAGLIHKYSDSEKEQISTLMLENIEALAGGEDDNAVYCVRSGTVDCPISNRKVEYVFEGYSLGNRY